jgi:plastocyanin
MGLRAVAAVSVAALALAGAPAAGAATKEVGANGNVFTGGLSFTPASVRAAVGDTVRWRNTDNVVPHTATENHRLWDLGGDYGQTPANPSGFGPGETVQRRFEAGTHSYFCRVHPTQMRGRIDVAPTLAVSRVRVRVKRRRHHRKRRHRHRHRRKAHRRKSHRRKSHRRKSHRRKAHRHRRHRHKRRARRRPRTRIVSYVVTRWSTTAPANGLVFDAQRRRPGGAWTSFVSGTRRANARFRVRRGRSWQVRARLRASGDASRSTGWSPAATITP